MMPGCFLVVFLASTTATAVESANAHVTRVGAGIEGLHSTLRSGSLHTRDGETASCAAAWQQLQSTIQSPECALLFDGSLDWDTVTEPEAQAFVDEYCTIGGCKETLVNDIEEFVRQCPHTPVWLTPDFFEFVMYVHVPCVSDGSGTFCFPMFVGFMRALEEAGDDLAVVTPAFLEQYCVPCIAVYFAMVAAFEPENAHEIALFGVLCMRDRSRWCIPEFNDFQKIADGGDVEDAFESACETRCFHRLSWAMSLYNASEEGIAFLRSSCVRDSRGRLCALRLGGEAYRLERSCPVSLHGGYVQCPSECQEAVERFSERMECCSRSLFAFQGSNEKANQMEQWVQDACGVTFPRLCQGRARVAVRFIVRNIVWMWLQDHLDGVQQAFSRDLAAASGVDYADISVSSQPVELPADSLSAADDVPGTIIEFTIDGLRNADAENVVEVFNDRASSATFVLLDGNLALEAGAKVEPAEACFVSQQSSATAELDPDEDEYFWDEGTIVVLILLCCCCGAMITGCVVFYRRKRSNGYQKHQNIPMEGEPLPYGARYGNRYTPPQ